MSDEMASLGLDSDAGIEEEKEKDYFSYPHSTDYLALVNNNILSMATADKSRRSAPLCLILIGVALV